MIKSRRSTAWEGEDYSQAGGIPALTKAGVQRMAAAHAIGREAVIIVDDVVIFRYPAEQEPPRPSVKRDAEEDWS